ncbi:MAG: contractile injection system protein, VgrG/Pvc8 family [Candidatus Thiodiazotropha sp.]
MSGGLKSQRLILHGRPRFSIDGADEVRLNEDLIRLEVRADEETPACLEAVFKNWGQSRAGNEPNYLYFDNEILELGRSLSVFGGEGDNEATLFSGQITAIEGIYPESRAPEIRVSAEDRLQWLRMTQRSRLFEDASDQDIAQRLADDAGLRADSEAEGPQHVELLQVNQSELDLLRERARAVDGRIADEEGVLLFRPRRDEPAEPVLLTRQNELLNVTVCADLAHQRSEVRVHGWSVAEKAAIHESAGVDAARVEADNNGRLGVEILDEIQSGLSEELHLEAPATAEEALKLAETRLKRRARRFITARGVTAGTPGLSVGDRVDLVDLGDLFAGIYYLTAVRHSFDMRDGLRTWFVGERNDLGGRS